MLNIKINENEIKNKFNKLSYGDFVEYLNNEYIKGEIVVEDIEDGFGNIVGEHYSIIKNDIEICYFAFNMPTHYTNWVEVSKIINE